MPDATEGICDDDRPDKVTLKMRTAIWTEFCNTHQVDHDGVELFEHNNMQVATKSIGRDVKRLVLKRSHAMEAIILSERDKLVMDYETKCHKYDGLIYMMFKKDKSAIIPLYIGKTETFGKSNKNLSANLSDMKTSTAKFARWGDNYAYHIGDLSAVVLPGHDESKKNKKYESWANVLFEHYPTLRPVLKQPVYFWCKAWDSNDTGIWKEFGTTSLTFLEYLLIGVVSSIFPGDVLNTEGRNRG